MSKKSFTLLEILIAFFLLSLIAALVGVKIDGMVKSKQFHEDASSLLSTLRHFKGLALSHRTDIELTLINEKNGVRLRPSISEPALSKEPALLLQRIAPISFSKIVFYSSGRIEPIGILLIQEKEGEEVISLDLGALHFLKRN